MQWIPYVLIWYKIIYLYNTVVCISLEKKQILCSKWASFKRAWHTLTALLCPWPLGSKQISFGSFLKGAVCPCSSKGCKVVHRQTLWKITPSLTSCSFAAYWATETYCTFLETSNLPLFGDKKVRVGQDFLSSNFLVENIPKQGVSLQPTV